MQGFGKNHPLSHPIKHEGRGQSGHSGELIYEIDRSTIDAMVWLYIEKSIGVAISVNERQGRQIYEDPRLAEKLYNQEFLQVNEFLKDGKLAEISPPDQVAAQQSKDMSHLNLGRRRIETQWKQRKFKNIAHRSDTADIQPNHPEMMDLVPNKLRPSDFRRLGHVNALCMCQLY
jgi:hypothetical protein